MKAIRVHEFGGPEVLKLEEVPDPKAGPGQVVVRVHAIGVNPVETYIRAGKYGPRQFPFIPGSDTAGIVEEVGAGVTQFKVGDRVYTAGTVSGAYAEKALCTEPQVHPLPANNSFEQGASIGVPYATAYKALFLRGNAKAGETVLVHGASGGVGIASVQLARAWGMTVIGTGGTDAGRRLVLEQGAHHVLDHHQPDYLQQLMSLTADRGVDLILEMLANVNLANDLTVLARYGRVVVVGNRGNIEINPREAMMRDASILGMTLMLATDADLRGIHSALIVGLENQTLRPVIAKELPLKEAAKAHELILASGSQGKIILKP